MSRMMNRSIFGEFSTKKQLFIFGICLLLLISCKLIPQRSLTPTQTTQNEWGCIHSFDYFLYQMVKIDIDDDELYNLPTTYPSSPWVLTAKIPGSVLNSAISNIELARISSGETELWIRFGENVVKHSIGTDSFTTISASPYDKEGQIYQDVEVQSLFEMATGDVIGVNYPKEYDTVWQEVIPLFSAYNAINNKFEFYDIGLKYSAQQVGFGAVNMIPRDGIIISTSGNLIWIYQQQDGLYSYNPIDSRLQHHEVFFSGVVQRMVASQKGYVLFSQKMKDSLELSPGELVKYYPATQTIEDIKVPFFHWPDYGTLLYTNSGDLWIGIHGYLSKDGSWVLKNPDRLAYINLGAETQTYNWQQPKLLIQSSNGYLWYTNKKWDGLGVDGSAWYDPVSGEGCWFTTESGNIVEDSHKNLWMAIDEKIYKYALPQ